VAYGSSKRVGQWHGNVSQTKALRLSAMMLCIFAVYFIGTFPYFIVNVYDDGGIVNTHGSIQPIAIVMVSGRFCESF
jgi:hypothetical protein